PEEQPDHAGSKPRLTELEKVPPELMIYNEAPPIATGLHGVTCVASGPSGTLLVGGTRAIKTLSVNGAQPQATDLKFTPHDVHPLPDGRFAVITRKRLIILDADGTVMVQADVPDGRPFLTAVTGDDEHLLIADAGNREILRYGHDGKFQMRFGRKNSEGNAPGFVIPSPYFDITIASDGLVRATNTGRHRVEAYTTNGSYEFGWGTASMAIESFCGCCNPCYISVLTDGRTVTSEKGLNRIKIYGVDGEFEGVVAGPEHLVRDRAEAERACEDCRVGFAFDVASDAEDRVYALDRVTGNLRVFEPRGLS
ncbi:MAG: hypothetical protein O2923_02095, partial [Verrucomicrobia bacterium]|nr:hypothetical protein [Verrucomicrobiota bacterium]